MIKKLILIFLLTSCSLNTQNDKDLLPNLNFSDELTIEEFKVKLEWNPDSEDFSYKNYTRTHQWIFGGVWLAPFQLWLFDLVRVHREQSPDDARGRSTVFYSARLSTPSFMLPCFSSRFQGFS